MCGIIAHGEEKRRDAQRERKRLKKGSRGDRRQEVKADTQSKTPQGKKMPNFEGTWKMKSSENFEDLLKALGEDNLLFSMKT